jgi:hypothetical protein
VNILMNALGVLAHKNGGELRITDADIRAFQAAGPYEMEMGQEGSAVVIKLTEMDALEDEEDDCA